MKEIDPQEAKLLVEDIGPHIKRREPVYDPVFPDGRKDVCAVIGSNYGYDTVYVLWKTCKGIKYKEIDNSRYTKDYFQINEVIENNGNILVKYSVRPLQKEYTISKKRIDEINVII